MHIFNAKHIYEEIQSLILVETSNVSDRKIFTDKVCVNNKNKDILNQVILKLHILS